jgi:hypothetical protein
MTISSSVVTSLEHTLLVYIMHNLAISNEKANKRSTKKKDGSGEFFVTNVSNETRIKGNKCGI